MKKCAHLFDFMKMWLEFLKLFYLRGIVYEKPILFDIEMKTTLRFQSGAQFFSAWLFTVGMEKNLGK